MAKIETDGGEPVTVGMVFVPNYEMIRDPELTRIIKRSGIPRVKFE